MTRKYSSRSQQTTLAYAISSSDTTIQVKSGSTLIPAITVGTTDTYSIVIDPDTALEEIVDVSNYTSGDTLTVTRAIDGSPAVAHAAGAVVRHMVTGRDLREAVRTSDAGVVTDAMLAGSIAKTKITGTAVTVADTGTVTNTMLAGSIAPSKITGTAITAADTGTVTGTMIANNTIVDADINASAAIAKTKISGTAVTVADTGTVTNAMLAGSIEESKHQLVTIGTGSLSGTSTSISLSGTYRRLFIYVTGWSSNSTSLLNLRLNNDSGSNYYTNGGTAAGTSINIGQSLAAASVSYATVIIELADQTTIPKMIICDGSGVADGRYSGTSAISSIQLVASAGSFDAGTYAVYGQ